ncbi:MAG: lysophospholipid acyltransferase family protein [Candidatus Binataceae bacterium]
MARQIGLAQARLEYSGIRLFLGALRALPYERAIRAGAWLGSRAMTLDRGNRPIAMRNLEVAFPALEPQARLEILRNSYRNWGRMLAEWVHSDRLNRENIERYVTYENRDYREQAAALARGRGILLLTAHFGNFELLALAHSIYGNRIAFVHRPMRNPLVDSAMMRVRNRAGNHGIERRGAGRAIVNLLRQNWLVGVLLDLDVRRGVFVDFFSLAASTSGGLARMSMLTGAPVVPVFIVREGDSSRHRIIHLDPIEACGKTDHGDAIRENTQRYTAAIEFMIRRYPDHWNWIHRRWKTRPPGEPRFY